MNKKLFLLALCSVLLISLMPAVHAAQYKSIWAKAGDFLLNDVASLKWLDNDAEKLAALIRICLWILIFTIIFAVTGKLQPGGSALLTRNMGMVVAAVFATISTFLIPAGLLIALGEAYSTFFSAALIGILVLAVWYLLYKGPIGNMTDRKMQAAIRIAILLVIISILDLITGWIHQDWVNLPKFI
jgi:hypothetical protein